MKMYDLMQDVNTRGTYTVSRSCIPHLKKSENPHILTSSPPLNMQPHWFGNHVAYTVAKYGMSMCTLGMAVEFAADAAYEVMPRPSRDNTGNFCLDDEVLAGAGKTDLSEYSFVDDAELQRDVFLDG